jgi:hypothetical protein
MNLNTRSSEVKAVTELLESGDYETSEALAEAVIKLVANLLQERATYGVGFGLPTDDVVIPRGPYYHLGDAKRVVAAYQEQGLRAYVAPLLSPVTPQYSEALKSLCGVCNHAVQLHDSRGCWVTTRKDGRCPCREH